MNCHCHPEKPAVCLCMHCHRPLCAACACEIEGKMACCAGACADAVRVAAAHGQAVELQGRVVGGALATGEGGVFGGMLLLAGWSGLREAIELGSRELRFIAYVFIALAILLLLASGSTLLQQFRDDPRPGNRVR